MTDVRHLIDVRAFRESTFIEHVESYSSPPWGERLGEGVMQKVIFVLPPHLASPPRGRGT
jgi:hypothetical protein